MINITNLELQFGDQVIFDDINCTINKDSKIGLVGRNGTGKSTLLKIIAQKHDFHSGTVETQKNIRIAYMPQEVVITSDKNVFAETMTTFQQLFDLEQEKKDLESIINDDPTDQQVNRYAEIENELLEQRFNEKKVQAKKILAGLGFDESKQASLVAQLSVGWRMRIVLAKLLLQEADFYLFDEPTNHLDLPTKNWFLQFLQKSSFGYLLVCHDRYFLDKACTSTFELSLGNLNIFHGNYSFYKKQKAFLKEHQEQAYKKQQQEIKQKKRTIERFRSKSTKAKMAQSMIKSLEKIDVIQIEETQKTISLQLEPPKRSGHQVLVVENVSFSFDRPIFQNISLQIERGDKVALVAPNGTGKTTLFNLIAKKLELQKGSVGFGHHVKIALFDQDQEKVLDPLKTIFEEVYQASSSTEEQVRSVLGALLFSKDDTYKHCSVLSGGERNRVAMAKVILSKANFLLLDEPTNHLDIESKEIILQALQQFEGTILFVSHDQDFVNKLSNKIIELTPKQAHLYLGNYDRYLEHKAILSQKPDNPIKQKIETQEKSKDSFEQQKKCKNLENKIERLEKKLQQVVQKLGAAEYGTKQFEQLENEYKVIETEIKDETKKWEDLLLKIEGETL